MMSSRFTTFVAVALFVCAVSAVIVSVRETDPLAREARAVVSLCADAVDRQACYEERIPALYPEHSIPDLFGIIRIVRRLDSSYQFCHLLAHKVGSIAIAEDPSRWLSAFPLNPKDGLCSNGFLHGVMIERFREASFDDAMMADAAPELQRVCEANAYWAPTSLDKGMCYHGLGHLAVSLADGDLEKAVRLCHSIVPKSSVEFMPICFEGVFMQIFQPVEPDDYELIEPLKDVLTRERYRSLCARFLDPEVVGACLREAWPLFTREILDGTGAAAFCSEHPTVAQEDKCYTTVSTVIGRTQIASPGRARAACLALPERRRAECLSVGAIALIEEDRRKVPEALVRCVEGGSAAPCLALVAERMSYMYSNEELLDVCAYFPYAYHEVCVDGGRGTP